MIYNILYLNSNSELTFLQGFSAVVLLAQNASWKGSHKFASLNLREWANKPRFSCNVFVLWQNMSTESRKAFKTLRDFWLFKS
ncbi:MAG: hypothetical protein EAZ95_08895 [Bacteroidetes bacterium]|nr:MAG: hypothetical protein EAZ95_08895 [Bacteroidota bacterium]